MVVSSQGLLHLIHQDVVVKFVDIVIPGLRNQSLGVGAPKAHPTQLKFRTTVLRLITSLSLGLLPTAKDAGSEDEKGSQETLPY